MHPAGTRSNWASPFEKGGLRGICRKIDRKIPPNPPFSKGGNSNLVMGGIGTFRNQGAATELAPRLPFDHAVWYTAAGGDHIHEQRAIFVGGAHVMLLCFCRASGLGPWCSL